MILTNILGMKIHRNIIMNVRNLHIYDQKINSFALITINIFCENITSFNRGRGNLMYVQRHYCSIHRNPIEMFYFRHTFFLGGLSLHLNHLYSIAHDNLRLAIWDTFFWTFWLKFGYKGP